jgi:N-acetylneuraminate synthase
VENERQTVVLQRRAVRVTRALSAGHVLTAGDVEPLRPAPEDGIFPYEIPRVLGRALRREVAQGEHIRWEDLAGA